MEQINGQDQGHSLPDSSLDAAVEEEMRRLYGKSEVAIHKFESDPIFIASAEEASEVQREWDGNLNWSVAVRKKPAGRFQLFTDGPSDEARGDDIVIVSRRATTKTMAVPQPHGDILTANLNSRVKPGYKGNEPLGSPRRKLMNVVESRDGAPQAKSCAGPPDPLAAGYLRTNILIWTPREYYFKVFEIRMKQVKREWGAMLGTISHNAVAYPSKTGPRVLCEVDECDTDFARLADLKRHEERHGTRLPCPKAGCSWRGAKRMGRLESHLLKAHPDIYNGEFLLSDNLEISLTLFRNYRRYPS